MKIALCLSGLMRTWEETYPFLYKNLLSVNENIDIFIHTWDKLDRHLLSYDINSVVAKYKPKGMVVEPFKIFEGSPLMIEKNINNKRDISGIISMYYKVKACNDLKTKHENANGFKYDCVIRFRPDIKLEEQLIISNKYDFNKLYIPNFGDYFGVNDQLAISSSSIMDTYSSTFNHLDEYIKEMIMVDPELFLQNHMLANGLRVKRFPLKYTLLAHNSILNNEIREKAWALSVRT